MAAEPWYDLSRRVPVYSFMSHATHPEELILVCEHVSEPNIERLVVDGGDQPMVACEECSHTDWSKVDWDKVAEVTRRFSELKIVPGSKEAEEYYSTTYNPTELQKLHLACKACTIEAISGKIKVMENQTVESLGPCRECGKPILVKHELATGIHRLAMLNQGYNFDIGASERELVITVRKRGSSRVTEPGEEHDDRGYLG